MNFSDLFKKQKQKTDSLINIAGDVISAAPPPAINNSATNNIENEKNLCIFNKCHILEELADCRRQCKCQMNSDSDRCHGGNKKVT